MQLWGLANDGGLFLLMIDLLFLLFMLLMCHFHHLLDEGASGPFLLPDPSSSMSSSLFSKSLSDAQLFSISHGAVSIFNESHIHQPMIFPEVILPDNSLFKLQGACHSHLTCYLVKF